MNFVHLYVYFDNMKAKLLNSKEYMYSLNEPKSSNSQA